MKDYFYAVPEHGNNVAGISATMLYCLYKAVREGKQVTFVHKKIFFGGLLKRKRLLPLVHRHALFDLESPHIRPEPSRIVYAMVSWFWGFIFLTHWIWEYLLHRLGLLGEEFGKMALVGFGISDIYNVERLPTFFPESVMKIGWEKELNHPPKVSFPARRFAAAVEGMGLNPRTYVCLHIRTPHYRGISDVSYENTTRNADPKNYDPAIDGLIAMGYKVVRMGDPVPGFIAPREGFFDYANSKFKSEERDLSLIENCFFYFGTNSGIYDTAVLFGVPILLVNVADLHQARPTKSSDIFIWKHVRPIARAETVPFGEIFKLPFLHNFLEEYIWVENAADDIRAAALEMAEQLRGSPGPLTDKQKLFHEGLNGLLRRTLKDSPYFQHNKGDRNRNHVEDAYRHAIQANFNGRVGSAFAEKYYG